MKISTRGRYAARAMLDLAMNQGHGPVLLRDIATRQQISLRYLEQLITPLGAAGIIRSVRGPKGGIVFSRPPEDILLGEVVRVVEGGNFPVECTGSPEVCGRSADCTMRDIWDEMRVAMNSVLDSVTLADLAERQRSRYSQETTMYYV
ncbi:RrF2 family transcriptional regulator [Chloroflexota bacterium]